MNETEAIYPCVGICTPDPDSGYCLGCGRPPEVSMASQFDAVVTIEPKPTSTINRQTAASFDAPDSPSN